METNNNLNRVKQKQPHFFNLPKVEGYVDYKNSLNVTIFVCYSVLSFFTTYKIESIEIKSVIRFTMLAVLIILYRGVLLRDLRIFKVNIANYLMFLLTIEVPTLFFSSLAAGITIADLPLGASGNQDIFVSVQKQSLIFAIIAAVIVAPIMEELMYRRLFKITIKNKFIYYLFSTLFLGMIHVMVSFSFPVSFLCLIPSMITGLGLTFVFDYTNNIWCSIATHAFFNAFSLLLVQLLA